VRDDNFHEISVAKNISSLIARRFRLVTNDNERIGKKGRNFAYNYFAAKTGYNQAAWVLSTRAKYFEAGTEDFSLNARVSTPS